MNPMGHDVPNTIGVTQKGLEDKIREMIPGYMAMGGTHIPTQLTPGDIVVLPTMGFTKFEFEGQEYWIGKENEVLAKINKNNE